MGRFRGVRKDRRNLNQRSGSHASGCFNKRDAVFVMGSSRLDQYISPIAPADSNNATWLPAPPGSFNLTFRFYWPKDEILKGKWIPPAVKPEL
jgi:hypothetical protein